MLRTTLFAPMVLLLPAAMATHQGCAQESGQTCALNDHADGESSKEMQMSLMQTHMSIAHQKHVGRKEKASLQGQVHNLASKERHEVRANRTKARRSKTGYVEEVDMAELSNVAYQEEPDETVESSGGADWELKYHASVKSDKAIISGTDFFSIYRRGSVCTLAIAGTDDLADMVSNLDMSTTSGCGIDDLHEGFWKELTSITTSDGWRDDVAPMLGGSDCSGGVYAVGHSLGGALAEILAYCANAGKLADLQHAGAQTFKVTKVYTFGAPSVSKTQLTDINSGGCFDGKRFYSFDALSYDPVPFAFSGDGFHHPEIAAVKLEENIVWFGSRRRRRRANLDSTSYSCSSASAKDEPGSIGTRTFSYFDHKHIEYISRIEKLFG